MKYKPEIDGLRAISIIAVLLYHLGYSWVPSGFSGVDIFFVISGYLIASNIKNDVDKNSFSFSEFYSRRIRRIFPALIFLILLTSIAGYFFLAPGDYESQGKSAVAAAASFANIYFYWNTGYFDNASNTLPLLHTWSLGVEEQFYIFLPIFLLLLSKTKFQKYLPTVLILTVIALLLLSISRVATDQKSAFYLMYYRAWELGAGCILAYSNRWQNYLPRQGEIILPIAGLALILFSLFSHLPADNFPGLGAIPAVSGAALILAFSGKENIINKALRTAPLVFLGKISYSLYLWHWPLIVYWRHYTSGASLTNMEQILIGLISIVLGWASWRFVETPARRLSLDKWTTIKFGSIAMILVAIPSAIVAASKGVSGRLPIEYKELQSKETMWEWKCPENLSLQGNYICSAGAPWKSAIQKSLIIGDSHAQHMMPLLHEAGIQSRTAIALLGSCPPIFRSETDGLRHSDPEFNARCVESRNVLFKFLDDNKDVKTVIIAAIWPMLGHSVYKDSVNEKNHHKTANKGNHSIQPQSFSQGKDHVAYELEQLAKELLNKNVRTIVISDIPTFERDPIPCILTKSNALLRRSCSENSEFVSKASMETYQTPMAKTLKDSSQRTSNYQVLVPTDALCRREFCDAYIDGTYIYRDADHIRRNMSRDIYKQLSERIGLSSALALP